MPTSIESPYDNNSKLWLKGNLHAHTTESDGKRSPQAVVNDYAARGYDFLMISDHDKLTDPAKLDARGMTLIPGNEVSAKGPHLLHINAKTRLEPDPDRQKVLDSIAEQRGLAVLNHPNWHENYNHCPQEKLASWKNYIGIEIFNGVIRRLPGSEYATDRWDQLLGSGKRVWGFANDDSHTDEDAELGWNVVQSASRSVQDICTAMERGAFYASTGLKIESIQVHGRTLHVRAPEAERIVLSCDYGRRVTHIDRPEITFHVPEDVGYSYLRVECHGRGERVAWTQPFFIKRS
ncbi:MAG TPA: CehA/McbA family metallohydrolase [Planctomycetota bacterium]|nr:CehA/McbA family metallohydrolase [Planctomycetota bacterium]